MALSFSKSIVGLVAVAAAAATALAAHSPAPEDPPEWPLKFKARSTSGDITATDLMSRLYVFADDSMMGRDDGGPVGNIKGTKYIEHEVRALGLTPGGDNGTFFQDIGYRTVLADSRSTLSAGSEGLVLGRDFQPVPRVGAHALREDLGTVFGGLFDSTAHITADQAAGKMVIVMAPRLTGRGGRGGRGGPPLPADLRSASVIAVVQPDTLTGVSTPARGIAPTIEEAAAAGPSRINVTARAARFLLGADLATTQPGTTGKRVHVELAYAETRFPVRNVVAILPGTDKSLRNEYVAVGAHSDHVGFNTRPVDHDSLRAYNRVMRPRGANDPVGSPTPEQWAQITHIRDSLRTLHPARLDSISNGADDDGSGSVALLEIAESFARGARPKRSVVFVWHASEEDGLLGSHFFSDHPAVPREAIVAQINTDMIGRGRATDHDGGGASYLRVVGSRRLSTELGDIVERVNRQGKHGFVFDYSYDAPGHPLNAYCRSDHYNYARYGIPIAYFGTGTQADYHMVTDEPQYIDYPNMARRVKFMRDVVLTIGNLDHRPLVDKPVPDPLAPCRQ